jgi:hypothetical protein
MGYSRLDLNSRRGSGLPDPISPTPVERIIASAHLPYLATSALLAALLSDFGMALFRFFDTRNWATAAALPVHQAGTIAFPPWVEAFSSVMFGVTYFFAFYFLRKARTILVSAQDQLSALLPEGSDDFRRIFGRYFKSKAPLAVMCLFTIPFLPYFIILFQYSTGIFSLIWTTVCSVVIIATLSAVLWLYVSALKGLHDIGNLPLRLRPFFEDSMLGLRRVGNLSLSLAGLYNGAIVLFALGIITSPFQNPIITAGVVGLFFLGAFLFFLPLMGFHRQMVRQKRLESDQIRQRFIPLLQSGASSGDASQKTVDDLWRLHALDTVERKVGAMHTWPFDIGVLTRLTTLTALPLLLTVVGRLIIIVTLHV